MKNLIKKYKIYLLPGLLIIIIIAFIILRGSQKPSAPQITPVPETKFELLNSFPSEGGFTTAFENIALEFTFSKPIDFTNTTVTIKPQTDIEIKSEKSGTILTVHPRPSWDFETKYTVIIKTVSKKGEELDEPISTNFTLKPMTDSGLTGP